MRVHQNNVISTVRRTDVAADPTTGLALEAVARRESGAGDVHVVSIQRVTRAQRFSGPLSFAHFTLLGMVSVGRGHRFGLATLTEHAAVQARAIMSAGADAVVVSLSDWDSAFPEWAESVVAAVEDARVEVVEASDRVRARGYYEGAAFEVSARFGETQIDVGDGGVVDWASRMLGDGNERMVISGIGVDRLALVRSG